MLHPPLRVLHIYISPGHNFFGKARQEAGIHPQLSVPAARLFAGRGIEGDRYLDYKANYKGQITFFDEKVYQDLSTKLQVTDKNSSVFRRNIVTSGYDLNALIGQEFEIQGVQFKGTEECSPCAWMNQAFAPGAKDELKGRGGLRARILTDGWIRVS